MRFSGTIKGNALGSRFPSIFPCFELLSLKINSRGFTGEVDHHDLELIKLNHAVVVLVDFLYEVVPLLIIHMENTPEHSLQLLLSYRAITVLYLQLVKISLRCQRG